jgi:hypothetical protein
MSVSAKLVLENTAILIGGTLALAFSADWVAGRFGYHPGWFCWVLRPMMEWAYAVGFFFTVIGIIWWAFSFFRNPAGGLLAIGGFMLTFLPQVMPHYLGVTCVMPQ